MGKTNYYFKSTSVKIERVNTLTYKPDEVASNGSGLSFFKQRK